METDYSTMTPAERKKSRIGAAMAAYGVWSIGHCVPTPLLEASRKAFVDGYCAAYGHWADTPDEEVE